MKRTVGIIRRTRKGGGLSPAMKAMALDVSRESGIRPLQPGQSRPADYYTVNHYTGKPVVKDANAVVPKREIA